MILLKEYILEAIQSTKIFEMAHDRAKMKDRIEGFADQILHNWCLVRYCNYYDKNNWNYQHWKDELFDNMYSILKLNLKGGNENAKYRLVHQTLINDIEINKYSYVKHTMHQKFKKEHFDIKEDIIMEFIDELPKIIDIISKTNTDKNYDALLDYIDSL